MWIKRDNGSACEYELESLQTGPLCTSTQCVYAPQRGAEFDEGVKDRAAAVGRDPLIRFGTAVAQRRPGHLRLARIWNVLGTVDLVTAVTLGVLHGRSPIGLLAGSVSTDAMTRYPLSLIPTWSRSRRCCACDLLAAASCG